MKIGDARVAAVVFDLDGILVDTEPLWAEAKHDVVTEVGGHWSADAPAAMLGMSGPEWSEYMREQLAVPLTAPEIRAQVVDAMLRRIGDGVELLDGAKTAVTEIAASWPIALASSADRPVIEAVLRATGIAELFSAIVASDEAGRGKPAPDVYLAATQKLGVAPADAVAVEDSGNGIRAASAAGMAVIAVPNPSTPVDAAALALASVVLGGMTDLSAQAVEDAAAQP